MRKRVLLAMTMGAVVSVLSSSAQTDAYIKLYDHHGKHPRVKSVTYYGDTDNLDMYNSLYGHGAVIENPYVAYRVYMDNRQSLDLYVKQTRGLELEHTGFYTTPQQLEKGYGCDVLWAGKSIGAGSFRGWDGARPLTIDSVAERTQTVISDHEVIVTDKDWIVNGHPVQMTQIYTVLPDSRDLYVDIKLEGHGSEDLFCTGIQKLETDNKGFISEDGYAASWGSDVPDKNYPEWIEQVGLAIEVDKRNIVESREDDLNYLFILRPDEEGKIRYKVISCGSREREGFGNADEWLEYIRSAARDAKAQN